MKLISASLLLGMLVLTGCVSHKVKHESARPSLPKIKDHKLFLEIPETRRVLSAAQNDELTFMLRSLGKKDIDLMEWQVDEVKNIHYYYRRYDENILEFDRGDPGWKEYLPDQSGPLRYTVLNLTPYNRVFINQPVAFIGKPGIYMVVGELLMSSVDVQTEITIIEITK